MIPMITFTGIYGPRGVDVPDPIQTVCTRWGKDDHFLGSYSHIAVGASGSDYDTLAESVGNGRIFFAGEATSRQYPATMHGAFLSGLREAANIANIANSKSMTMSSIERGLSKDNECRAALLDNLFWEPDLEFGKFSVLFDPQSSDPKSMAVLRVIIDGPRRKANDDTKPECRPSNKRVSQHLQSQLNQQLKLYALVQRQQAHELRKVEGGDEIKLRYLCEKFGVKLVGRRALGELGDSLVVTIRRARIGRRRI